MRTIYSVGSSNRSLEEFIHLLHQFKITTLIDVRSFPASRFHHFTKENLHQELTKTGVHYLFLGKELGGFRKEGYESYAAGMHYKQGIKKLEIVAEQNPTAFMCAEKLPWKCHRIFIARSLQIRGWHIIHIIDEKSIWESKE